MSARIIPITVENEYVVGSGVVIGAAGSGKDVSLRIEFSESWAPYHKRINWLDASGLNPVITILTDNLREPGTDNVYIVPVPSEPKALPGMAMVTINGYTLDDDQIESVQMSATAYFKILQSDWVLDDDGSVTATVAEQLQAAIAAKQDILTFDDEPEEGSSNPVTSDGIYQAIKGLVDGGGIFIATYDETTYAEVDAARQAGKLILALKPTEAFLLCGRFYDATTQVYHYCFTCIHRYDSIDKTSADCITLSSNDEWSSDNYELAVKDYVDAADALMMQKGVDYVTAGKLSGTSLGNQATAEGLDVEASGDQAHAEGCETVASNEYTHAEGYESQATGSTAHAEGNITTSSGYASHSEGDNTTASGDYSHAGGSWSVASGLGSFAIGLKTVAKQPYSTVFGQYNSDPYTGPHIEGTNLWGNAALTDYHNGTAKLVCRVHDTLTTYIDSGLVFDISYTDSQMTLFIDPEESALYSQLSGATDSITYVDTDRVDHSIPAWYYALQEGIDIPLPAVELGFVFQTNCATAILGDINAQIAPDPHLLEIVGNGTSTSNRSNARTLDAMGNEVLAGKLTLGAGPSNDLDAATKQYVDGSYVIAGKATGSTLGTKATAEGSDNIASGARSHAEGWQTEASGNDSHAEGQSTVAEGVMAHAEGFATIATGSHSHAEGSETETSANYSHTEGWHTQVNGSGTAAHAEGIWTIANGQAQHVGGKYNIADSTSLEIIGNGTANNARSNARVLDAQGNETLSGKLTVGVRGSDDMDVATLAEAYAAYVTETESGDIVTFSDGADSIPVKSFVGSIIPAQDLNGQSAPYPAGGGKNLLPMTVASIKALNTTGTWSGNAYTYLGVTYTIQTDDGGNVTGIATSGTASGSSRFDLYHDATDDTAIQSGRILNGCPSGGSTGTSSYKLSVWGNGSNADAGSGVTIASKNEWCSINVYNGTNVNGKTFYPMIRLSSVSDATFAPYSNICPISGWSGANITRAGKNLFDYAKAGNITIPSGAVRSGEIIRISAGNWTVSKANAGDAIYAGWNDGEAHEVSLAGVTSALVSAATDCDLYVWRGGGSSITGVANIQVEKGSTATAYEAYQGETITLAFGSTVYAGTITALGGGLWSVQATHGVITYNGAAAESWTYESPSNVCYIRNDALTKLDDYSTAILCDRLKTVERNGVVSSTDYSISGYRDTGGSYPTRNWIYVKADDTITSANAFKTWLAANPITVVYPLATLPDPITITGEDLQTLLGSNTVWTDVGSITEMEYRADTKKYIQKVISSL